MNSPNCYTYLLNFNSLEGLYFLPLLTFPLPVKALQFTSITLNKPQQTNSLHFFSIHPNRRSS